MYSQKLTGFVKISLIGMITLLFISQCDVYKQKDFQISDFDNKACKAITENPADTLQTIDLSTLNPMWVDTSFTADMIPPMLDSLQARKLIVQDREKAYLLIPPAPFYELHLKFVSDADKVVLFLDTSVELRIWNASGEEVIPSDMSMPLETIAACSEIIVRYEYSGVKGDNLLRISKNDQTKKPMFHLVILKK
ncbi:MAG: hypothetical protein GXO77_08505 [Calditrichaeota bacterium]|nr:hypothetical protein [Calditrichota bacterium]